MPSRYTGFDSVTGKKNSPVIKGHDGTTHRREWRGRDWLVTRMDELAYRTLPPPSPILLKIINVYHNCGTLDLMNIHLAKSANYHFAMFSSESASFRKLKLFKNGFKADQYQPSSFSFISSPSLAALFDNFGVIPASLRLKQNLYPCRIRML